MTDNEIDNTTAREYALAAAGYAASAETSAVTASTKANEASVSAANAALSASSAATSAAQALAASVNIAPEYSNESTYNNGDYVLKDGGMYRCAVDIQTPEEWVSAHWESTKVGEELVDIDEEKQEEIRLAIHNGKLCVVM